VIDRLLLRIESGKQRQQAGMDIQNPPRKSREKLARKQAHVPCETNKI
jgi:hypothetical protein